MKTSLRSADSNQAACFAETRHARPESVASTGSSQLVQLERVAHLIQCRLDVKDTELLDKVIDAIGDPIFVKDEQLRFVLVNQALCEFTAIARERFIGHTDADLFPPDQAQVFNERDACVLRSGRPDVNEETLNRADGSRRIIRTTKTMFRTTRGHKVLVGIFTDLTDLRSAQKELERVNRQLLQLSHCDALTGMPNRRAFEEQLARQLAHAGRSSEPFAVVFMDLNGFKQINDTYGHQAGDELIREIGARVLEESRARDFTARLGGDEFVVLARAADETAAARVAERLARAVARPVRLPVAEVAVTVSIGIARYPQDGTDAVTLVRNADAAMYRAKRVTHRAHEFHDARQTDAVRRRYLLETELPKDVASGRVGVHLQPICSLADRQCVGFEALARWTHAQLGPVSPDEFIPIAEDIDALAPLGELVLRQACSFIAGHGGAARYVAVNVSNRQIQAPGFVAMVWRILAETGARPEQLALELTESALCADGASLLLNELRARGVAVFIDDFGVGYSNLTRLHQLSFDAIKVDRGFISDIEHGGVATAMIRTIVLLASELGVRLIAEGIERVEQAEALKALGLSYAQGYLYGRPEAMAHWMGVLRDAPPA